MAAESTPNYYPTPKKQGVSKWVKIGVPVALIVLVAAGVGAYFGVRNKNNATTANVKGDNNGNGNGNGNGGTSINLEDSRLAISTDTWMMPVYPSTVSDWAMRASSPALTVSRAARPIPRSLQNPHLIPRTSRHGPKTTSCKRLRR
jgi:hypothetical protein